MPSPITKRSLLVAALLLGQLVCLLLAVVWFGSWLERGLSGIVRRRVLEASQQIAGQYSRIVALMDIQGLPLSAEDWERLQTLVEETRLPIGGYLVVIDNDTGQVLAHPDLRDNPAMADLPYAQALLSRPVEKPDQWTRMPDGSYLLAAKPLKNLGARILVIQPSEPMQAVVAGFITRMRIIGAIVTVVLVVISGLLSLAIVRAYENRMAHINEGLEGIVDRRSRALARSREGAIFGLAKLAEARDGETGEHLERICGYVQILARQVARRDPSLNEHWVRTLSVAASLHDIGKVGIPDAVLRKPARLTPPERAVVQKHPAIGGETLREIQQRWGDDPFLVIASEICFGHHEWWDGTGYPFGHSGVSIPLPARIVALADVYDALTSRRAYKEPLAHEQARRLILEQSGTHFDPGVVEAFLITEAQFRAISDAPPAPMSEPEPLLTTV